MRTIRYTAQFKKDFKLAQRRGRNIKLFKEILTALANDQPLDVRYRDHALMGRYSGTRAVSYTHLDVYKRQAM